MTIKFKQDPVSDVVIWGVRKLLTCFKEASLSMKLEKVAKTDRRYTITATIHAMTRDICRSKRQEWSRWSLRLCTASISETHGSLYLHSSTLSSSDMERKPSLSLWLLTAGKRTLVRPKSETRYMKRLRKSEVEEHSRPVLSQELSKLVRRPNPACGLISFGMALDLSMCFTFFKAVKKNRQSCARDCWWPTTPKYIWPLQKKCLPTSALIVVKHVVCKDDLLSQEKYI